MVLKKVRATLVDVDYVTRAGRAVIRLVMKRGRFFRLYDPDFEPYFYLEAAELNAAEEKLKKFGMAEKGERIVLKKVERERKLVAGAEKEVLRITCVHPRHVPIVRGEIAKLGRIYEYDIPFARRYLMDRGLSPFDLVEAEYEKSGRQRFVKRITRVGEGSADLRSVAFDIETYNPAGEPNASKDPVVMISYAGSGGGGKGGGAGRGGGGSGGKAEVLTYKQIKHKNFVRAVANEKAMIDEFCAVLKRDDVELMLGYNSAQFDLPYLKERARRVGTRLAIGRDGSGFREMKRGMNTYARVIGRIHIDLYPVARFLGIIGAIKAQKLSLGEVYGELMGREKAEKIDKLAVWRMWDDEKGREKLADYSLDDAKSTLEMSDKMLPMEIEMSRLVGGSLFDVCGASASQLVEMLLMRRAGERGMMIPNRPSDNEAGGRMEPVKGAYVKLPQAGIYDNLAVLDFRGLYPSIICAYNIDPFMLNCKDCGKDAHVSPVGHRFCRKRPGLMPAVLAEVIDKRAQLKNALKKHGPESDEYRKLYARSQALKVLANSYYGYLLYARSRWYSREAGESVTAWGRKYVQETAEKAEKAGFEVLYQDTDSTFLVMGKKTKEDVLRFLKEVNDALPERMELELEGFYKRGLFVMKKKKGDERGAKKKYALLDENGRIKIRGFELVRRDWSKIARNTQMDVLQAILKDGSKEKAVKIVREVVGRLKRGEVPLSELVIYTRLRKKIVKYVVTSPEVEAMKKAKEAGLRIDEGALIGYVITKKGKTISEKAQLVELAKDYDVDYYIDHQVLPSVLKILSELGLSEDELKLGTKQHKLDGW